MTIASINVSLPEEMGDEHYLWLMKCSCVCSQDAKYNIFSDLCEKLNYTLVGMATSSETSVHPE